MSVEHITALFDLVVPDTVSNASLTENATPGDSYSSSPLKHSLLSSPLTPMLHASLGDALASLSAFEEPRPGDRLNEYLTKRVIYSGTKAPESFVALAENTETGATVAIKGVPYRLRHRGSKEAELWSELDHPNIVPMLERIDDPEGGRVLMVLKYASGGVLGSVSRREGTCAALSEWQVLRGLRDASRALEYLHRNGVYHQDIKPENLLLDADGRVLVTDFGSAVKQRDATAPLKRQLGTIQYCAPETLGRDVSFLPGPADVWSLGMTMATLLLGAHPLFHANMATMIERIRTERVVLPSTEDSKCLALLQAMLSHNPEDRPTMSSVYAAVSQM